MDISICQRCHGTGLEPCEHNHNVKAGGDYIICKSCNGKGE